MPSYAVKRLPIDGVRLGEALEIGKHGAERHQIFEPTARRGDSATRSEHRVELHATCLIDRQRVALDCLARSAHQRGTREVASCIVEAMRCRSDLGLNKRCARRVVHACELRGERVQTVERVQIAEKLRCQTLLIDNRLGNARAARVLRETCPCATARALQVDRGDLPVGRGWTAMVKLRDARSRRDSEASLQTSETRLEQRRHHGLHDDVGLIVGQELHAPFGDASRCPSASLRSCRCNGRRESRRCCV